MTYLSLSSHAGRVDGSHASCARTRPNCAPFARFSRASVTEHGSQCLVPTDTAAPQLWHRPCCVGARFPDDKMITRCRSLPASAAWSDAYRVRDARRHSVRSTRCPARTIQRRAQLPGSRPAPFRIVSVQTTPSIGRRRLAARSTIRVLAAFGSANPEGMRRPSGGSAPSGRRQDRLSTTRGHRSTDPRIRRPSQHSGRISIPTGL